MIVERPVAFHDCGVRDGAHGHDQASRRAVAQRLAEVLGVPFLGDMPATALAARPALVVPSDTLTSAADARALGIRDDDHLYGGVVPRPFVATKVITHPLARRGAFAPSGWTGAFARAVRSVVLPGWTAFDRGDAIVAGESLLRDGALRIKEAGGVGGAGQHVVTDAAGLKGVLSALDGDRLRRDGVVLEANLDDVTTWSVGRVQVPVRGARLVASYVGTQRLVQNHRGHAVYGGSTLAVVRGDVDALLATGLSARERRVVESALAYHRAAHGAFRGLRTTRANYDVACGIDGRGEERCGVLEQSWRLGGASGAEVLALQALDADPALQRLQASTVEVYGDPGPLPTGAALLYDGLDDAALGRLVKYAFVND